MEYLKIDNPVKFLLDGEPHKGIVEEYQTPPDRLIYSANGRQGLYAPDHYVLRIKTPDNIKYFDGTKTLEVLVVKTEVYSGGLGVLVEYKARDKSLLETLGR